MDYNKIKVESFLNNQGICISLNAPKANILDLAMMREIDRALDDLKTRSELKLICFTGNGPHFSFGASVVEHLPEQAPQMLKTFRGLFEHLINLSVITVSAVRGQCLGGAMEIASFCHRIVAHPDAVFGQPEIQLGVFPPVAALILPAKVGQSKADEINLTGRSFEANACREMGLVDQIDEDPMNAVETWANQEIVKKSAASLRCTAQASRYLFNQQFNNHIQAIEDLYLNKLMQTNDAKEGLTAFLEKRKPVWQNN